MPRRLFLIVCAAVWTNFENNAAAVREEAVAARQLVRLALAMPEIHQAGLIELEHRYLQLILNQEWPLLASGGSWPATEQAFFALHARVIELAESAKVAPVLSAELLHAMGTFITARSQRLNLAHAKAGSTRWAGVLILGLLAQIGVALVHVEKKGPMVAALIHTSFVIVTALAVIAVSVSTHEGAIAVPKMPLVAVLQSAVAGG